MGVDLSFDVMCVSDTASIGVYEYLTTHAVFFSGRAIMAIMYDAIVWLCRDIMVGVVLLCLLHSRDGGWLKVVTLGFV